jgi:hypothetical protein
MDRGRRGVHPGGHGPARLLRRVVLLTPLLVLVTVAGSVAAQEPAPPTAPPESSTTTMLAGPAPGPEPPADDPSAVPDLAEPLVTAPPPNETAELPEEVATGASAPVTGASSVVAEERLARLLGSDVDAVAAARLVEADAQARLDEADASLVAARARVAAAFVERDHAATLAAEANAGAEQAERDAVAAREELRELAVAAYLDPPQDVEVAALRGEVAERSTASAVLAARADRLSAASRRFDRARDAARAAALEADQATARAEAGLAEAERQQQAVDALVVERTRVVAEVRALLERAHTRVLGFVASDALSQRLSVDAVTASGAVVVDRHADGGWSVTAHGFPTPAEIVRVPGTTIRVHQLIADRVAALVAAAAADGVALDGWGHRDALRQVELRRAHCGSTFDAVFLAPSASCAPPTARPGRSMHERGLAVDFAHCARRSTACHRWLAQHASAFGLYNLPSEPWHWSTNGN